MNHQYSPDVYNSHSNSILRIDEEDWINIPIIIRKSLRRLEDHVCRTQHVESALIKWADHSNMMAERVDSIFSRLDVVEDASRSQNLKLQHLEENAKMISGKLDEVHGLGKQNKLELEILRRTSQETKMEHDDLKRTFEKGLQPRVAMLAEIAGKSEVQASSNLDMLKSLQLSVENLRTSIFGAPSSGMGSHTTTPHLGPMDGQLPVSSTTSESCVLSRLHQLESQAIASSSRDQMRELETKIENRHFQLQGELIGLSNRVSGNFEETDQIQENLEVFETQLQAYRTSMKQMAVDVSALRHFVGLTGANVLPPTHFDTSNDDDDGENEREGNEKEGRHVATKKFTEASAVGPTIYVSPFFQQCVEELISRSGSVHGVRKDCEDWLSEAYKKIMDILEVKLEPVKQHHAQIAVSTRKIEKFLQLEKYLPASAEGEVGVHNESASSVSSTTESSVSFIDDQKHQQLHQQQQKTSAVSSSSSSLKISSLHELIEVATTNICQTIFSGKTAQEIHSKIHDLQQEVRQEEDHRTDQITVLMQQLQQLVEWVGQQTTKLTEIETQQIEKFSFCEDQVHEIQNGQADLKNLHQELVTSLSAQKNKTMSSLREEESSVLSILSSQQRQLEVEQQNTTLRMEELEKRNMAFETKNHILDSAVKEITQRLNKLNQGMMKVGSDVNDVRQQQLEEMNALVGKVEVEMHRVSREAFDEMEKMRGNFQQVVAGQAHNQFEKQQLMMDAVRKDVLDVLGNKLREQHQSINNEMGTVRKDVLDVLGNKLREQHQSINNEMGTVRKDVLDVLGNKLREQHQSINNEMGTVRKDVLDVLGNKLREQHQSINNEMGTVRKDVLDVLGNKLREQHQSITNEISQMTAEHSNQFSQENFAPLKKALLRLANFCGVSVDDLILLTSTGTTSPSSMFHRASTSPSATRTSPLQRQLEEAIRTHLGTLQEDIDSRFVQITAAFHSPEQVKKMKELALQTISEVLYQTSSSPLRHLGSSSSNEQIMSSENNSYKAEMCGGGLLTKSDLDRVTKQLREVKVNVHQELLETMNHTLDELYGNISLVQEEQRKLKGAQKENSEKLYSRLDEEHQTDELKTKSLMTQWGEKIRRDCLRVGQENLSELSQKVDEWDVRLNDATTTNYVWAEKLKKFFAGVAIPTISGGGSTSSQAHGGGLDNSGGIVLGGTTTFVQILSEHDEDLISKMSHDQQVMQSSLRKHLIEHVQGRLDLLEVEFSNLKKKRELEEEEQQLLLQQQRAEQQTAANDLSGSKDGRETIEMESKKQREELLETQKQLQQKYEEINEKQAQHSQLMESEEQMVRNVAKKLEHLETRFFALKEEWNIFERQMRSVYSKEETDAKFMDVVTNELFNERMAGKLNVQDISNISTQLGKEVALQLRSVNVEVGNLREELESYVRTEELQSVLHRQSNLMRSAAAMHQEEH